MPNSVTETVEPDKPTYAPRYKLWPPANYVAPSHEDFTKLFQTAKRYFEAAFFKSQWARMSNDTLSRHLQLVEIRPRMDGRTETAVYNYTRELRREMNRRGLVHWSIAVLRCASCSHATERLFEATQTTHPGMENRHGTLIDSAWFCARCWSGGQLGDEPADE